MNKEYYINQYKEVVSEPIIEDLDRKKTIKWIKEWVGKNFPDANLISENLKHLDYEIAEHFWKIKIEDFVIKERKSIRGPTMYYKSSMLSDTRNDLIGYAVAGGISMGKFLIEFEQKPQKKWYQFWK